MGGETFGEIGVNQGRLPDPAVDSGISSVTARWVLPSFKTNSFREDTIPIGEEKAQFLQRIGYCLLTILGCSAVFTVVLKIDGIFYHY
jgi:hypothetical protein